MYTPAQPDRWWPDPLEQKHVEGCRVFADRQLLIEDIGSRARGGRIAEIGTEYGNFTAFLLQTLKPTTFHGYDLFDLHTKETYGHSRPRDVMGSRTHRAYFEDRFSEHISAGTMKVFEGDSSTEMMKQPDGFYDLIYVDGDHTIEGASRDAGVARLKVNPGGVLVFNDYALWDGTHKGKIWPYGVVHCVNHLCHHHGWRMAGFALQRTMFCDLALVRD